MALNSICNYLVNLAKKKTKSLSWKREMFVTTAYGDKGHYLDVVFEFGNFQAYLEGTDYVQLERGGKFVKSYCDFE